MQAAQGISYRLFIGFCVTAEVRSQLSQSALWKEAQIVSGLNPQGYKVVRFGDKDYLGLYLQRSCISLNELLPIEETLRCALREFCPHLKQQDQISIRIFSQPFIH
jgi:hypothetical protein